MHITKVYTPSSPVCLNQQAQVRQGEGHGGKIPVARTAYRAQNLGKTPGYGGYGQVGLGPVMCNHLPVLGTNLALASIESNESMYQVHTEVVRKIRIFYFFTIV